MNSIGKTLSLKLITENPEYNNEYLQNKNNNNNQIVKFLTPRKTAKLKTSDNKDRNNFASLNRFKVLEERKKNTSGNYIS